MSKEKNHFRDFRFILAHTNEYTYQCILSHINEGLSFTISSRTVKQIGRNLDHNKDMSGTNKN